MSRWEKLRRWVGLHGDTLVPMLAGLLVWSQIVPVPLAPTVAKFAVEVVADAPPAPAPVEEGAGP